MAIRAPFHRGALFKKKPAFRFAKRGGLDSTLLSRVVFDLSILPAASRESATTQLRLRSKKGRLRRR
ncbi:MAG: hypothetical protein A3D67_00650 [Candidatus Lloydbacteria bacterium RIFCSPHIGHO2_02_FULL_51_22]|uniref:Uncharacterized protein n=1 Tax=Candidatus Lloydbacteria bacterium RIFCSPHIGHO2_02_FULL_51_22 TaxID=1798663 RepID=A0A1G2DFH8_9BACT|nr:MAG: hypothetical protein A3D67_00650 [Candidatus Lloydbacteria bacterium RIFCSPHIGHO2_02_FULL_51_22]